MAGIRNLQLPNTHLIYADKIIFLLYIPIKGNNTFLLPLGLSKVSSHSEWDFHGNKGWVRSSAQSFKAQALINCGLEDLGT